MYKYGEETHAVNKSSKFEEEIHGSTECNNLKKKSWIDRMYKFEEENI